jgi:hypothetical protein
VFGSQKRRPDTPIGDDGDTHRPDTVNFSCPPPSKRVTRSQLETLPTIIEESSPSVQEVQVPSPAGLGFKRYQIENFAMGEHGVPSCDLIELRMEKIKTSNSKLLTKT